MYRRLASNAIQESTSNDTLASAERRTLRFGLSALAHAANEAAPQCFADDSQYSEQETPLVEHSDVPAFSNDPLRCLNAASLVGLPFEGKHLPPDHSLPIVHPSTADRVKTPDGVNNTAGLGVFEAVALTSALVKKLGGASNASAHGYRRRTIGRLENNVSAVKTMAVTAIALHVSA